MDAGQIIAEETFLMSELGSKGTLIIRIEKPCLQPNKSWSCSMCLQGLSMGSDFTICGDSSLQALALSIKFIVTLLTNQMDDGTLTLAFTDGAECDAATLKSILGFL